MSCVWVPSDSQGGAYGHCLHLDLRCPHHVSVRHLFPTGSHSRRLLTYLLTPPLAYMLRPTQKVIKIWKKMSAQYRPIVKSSVKSWLCNFIPNQLKIGIPATLSVKNVHANFGFSVLLVFELRDRETDKRTDNRTSKTRIVLMNTAAQKCFVWRW